MCLTFTLTVLTVVCSAYRMFSEGDTGERTVSLQNVKVCVADPMGMPSLLLNRVSVIVCWHFSDLFQAPSWPLSTRGTYGLLQGVRALGRPVTIIPGSAGSLNNQSVGRLRSSTAHKNCRTQGSLRMIGPSILDSTSLKDCLILPSDGQPYHQRDLSFFS